MIKFSKTYSNIFKIKEDYIKNNSRELKEILRINKFYSKQKIRKNCKICNKKLNIPVIKSFSVTYIFCNKCNHLNGRYEDSKNFHKYLYSGSTQNLNFGKIYLKNFSKIVKNIHYPKINFLKKVVKEKLFIIDFGSGAGHFVKACSDKNTNAWGVEENIHLYNFSKKKIGNRALLAKDINLEKLINKFKINCLSLIFVLEHLPDPHYIFKLFKKTKIKYLYLSVPLASPLIFFENAFKNVYPRHLGGAHTHLFTKESLNYLKKKYKLKIIGEWWFGTDFADLYRSLIVNYDFNNKKEYSKRINKFLLRNIDKFQEVLDKQKYSSEVHLVFQK